MAESVKHLKAHTISEIGDKLIVDTQYTPTASESVIGTAIKHFLYTQLPEGGCAHNTWLYGHVECSG
jgi:hypothetical protein